MYVLNWTVLKWKSLIVLLWFDAWKPSRRVGKLKSPVDVCYVTQICDLPKDSWKHCLFDLYVVACWKVVGYFCCFQFSNVCRKTKMQTMESAPFRPGNGGVAFKMQPPKQHRAFSISGAGRLACTQFGGYLWQGILLAVLLPGDSNVR